MLRLLLLLTLALGFSVDAQDERDWALVFFNQEERKVLLFYPEESRSVSYGSLPENYRDVLLSPDSRYVAYTTVLPTDTDSGPPSLEIYWRDPSSGQQIKLAEQPDDRPVLRSAPVWSPDGTQLAWTEDFESGRLFIADVPSGEVRLVRENIPPQTLVPNPPRIQSWTAERGILIQRIEYDDSLTTASVASFDFYDADGGLTAVPNPLPGADRALVVRTEDGEQLMVNDGQDWYLLAEEGEPELLTQGVVARQISAYPDSLMIGPSALSEDPDVRAYNLYDSAGKLLETLNAEGDLDQITPFLVDTGQTIYLDALMFGDILLYRAGEGISTVISSVDHPLLPPRNQTRVLLPDVPTLLTGPYCAGGDLSFRLDVGDNAYVLPGEPNNIRREPSPDGELIGAIPSGDWFTVLAGPVCNDELAWWQIEYEGITAWTAEGADGVYWLAPGCPAGSCARG